MKILISTEFFYYNIYQMSWPRPVPTPTPISLEVYRYDNLYLLILSWKFEENQLKIDEVMNRKRDEKERRKIKKRQNENSRTKVGNLN